MSKVDESSWVTLSITFTPDDIMEIEDAIANLHLHWDSIRTKSGILEHIVEQYKAKRFEPEDFEFMKELVSLGRTPEGRNIITSSKKVIDEILKLHDKYGKLTIDRAIALIKSHEDTHATMKQEYSHLWAKP